MALSPAPLRRARSVSGEVGAYVDRLIATELSPGDQLPTERELAETLAVSRTSVREALRELEQRRLIERTPGRGTTVRARSATSQALTSALAKTTVEDADVAELRLLVEPQIAALAARRAGDTDLALLEQTLADSHAGLTPTESLALDVQFHTQLAAAARNPLLVSLCELTNDWVQVVRARSHATRAGRRHSVDGHRQLYEAVVAADPDLATAAMIDHLGDVARLIAQTPRLRIRA